MEDRTPTLCTGSEKKAPVSQEKKIRNKSERIISHLVPLHDVSLLDLDLHEVSPDGRAHVLRVVELRLLPGHGGVLDALVLDADRAALPVEQEVQLPLARQVERVRHHHARHVQPLTLLNHEPEVLGSRRKIENYGEAAGY